MRLKRVGICSLVATVLSCVAMAGCGGTPQTGVHFASSMSRYLVRGDTLCAELNKEVGPRQERISRLLDAPQVDVEAAGKELLAAASEIRVGITRFRNLGPAPFQQRQVNRMLGLKGAEAGTLESLAAAIESAEAQGFHSLLWRQGREEDEYRDVARSLGFRYCGHKHRHTRMT